MKTMTTETINMNLLPEQARQELFDFYQFLLSRCSVSTSLKPQKKSGVNGKALAGYAGIISAEKADRMAEAIKNDCGKVDLDEW